MPPLTHRPRADRRRATAGCTCTLGDIHAHYTVVPKRQRLTRLTHWTGQAASVAPESRVSLGRGVVAVVIWGAPP